MFVPMQPPTLLLDNIVSVADLLRFLAFVLKLNVLLGCMSHKQTVRLSNRADIAVNYAPCRKYFC
jgi:hypothetical protein